MKMKTIFKLYGRLATCQEAKSFFKRKIFAQRKGGKTGGGGEREKKRRLLADLDGENAESAKIGGEILGNMLIASAGGFLYTVSTS